MLNLKEDAGEQFRNALRGNLYGPRDEGYEQARKSYNASISLGLTITQLSERLRCAERGGPLHSVKPWRMERLGKPLGAAG
jgi:hypothetical protein